MTKHIAKLGADLKIDVDKLIESRLLIQANSGGGKSWTVRKLIEESCEVAQTIVIDPDGEYHTLREKYDFVLAGKDGDCPADIKSAAMLAKKLLQSGVSAIIDIYELGQHRALFVQRFLDAMTNAPRELWHPVIVIVDEAHKFCPESGKCVSTNAVIDLCTLGRKRGFCPVLATQRIAKLHKDAAAECNNVLIGRTGLDIDMKRAADTLGMTTRDDRMTLRELNAGEFFAFGPAIIGDGVQLFKIGNVKTTHLRAGQRAQKPPPPTSKIKKMLGELADLPHEAEEEAKSVGDLQAKVRELQAELKAAYKTSKVETKTIEKVVVKPAEVKRLEKVAASFHHYVDMAGVGLERLSKVAGEAKEIANAIAKAVRPLDQVQRPAQVAKPAVVAPTRKPAAAASNGHSPHLSGEDILPAGEARVLTALIQFPDGLTGSQLSALTGYTQPTRDKYLTNLSTKGLAQRDRPGHAVAVQPAASSALPSISPLPTGEELRDYWFSRLPSGESAVLKVICEAWPEEIHGSKISELTGYTQPTRDKYVTNLSGKTIVDRTRPGYVKANPQLFD